MKWIDSLNIRRAEEKAKPVLFSGRYLGFVFSYKSEHTDRWLVHDIIRWILMIFIIGDVGTIDYLSIPSPARYVFIPIIVIGVWLGIALFMGSMDARAYFER